MKLISPNTCNELLLWDQNLKIKTFFVTKVKEMHFSNLISPSLFVIIFIFREVLFELWGSSSLFLLKRKRERENCLNTGT